MRLCTVIYTKQNHDNTITYKERMINDYFTNLQRMIYNTNVKQKKKKKKKKKKNPVT
eukprot:NODE_28472_length_476_cov_1.813754.p1 GENE.NODE_28472_length_476_cov_1.813754~~NODE_28472_length_476_cov_1.813754.p1  ORF type:complete len:57 (-),score=8.77 NODE_28472_length_476_cov_1.813754:119-289(-)